MNSTITYKIEKTPDNHDSDSVRFYVNGEERGYGYKGKKEGSLICLMRCPACDSENYIGARSLGLCAFCQYNPNEVKE